MITEYVFDNRLPRSNHYLPKLIPYLISADAAHIRGTNGILIAICLPRHLTLSRQSDILLRYEVGTMPTRSHNDKIFLLCECILVLNT